MEVSPLLVDWNRLQTEWTPDGPEPSWFEIDEDDNWARSPETDIGDSAIFNSEISEVFWSIGDRLAADERRVLGQFINAFSVTMREDDEDEKFTVPFDIERPDINFVASALSHASVDKYLGPLAKISLGKVSEISDEEIEEMDGILEAGDFLVFIEGWAAILREAKALGWGVLVLIYG